jgi:hypothetical protein
MHRPARTIWRLCLAATLALFPLALAAQETEQAEAPPVDATLEQSAPNPEGATAVAPTTPTGTDTNGGAPSEPDNLPLGEIDAGPEGNYLSGAQIYDRVLQNRFDAYEQKIRMESGDRGGNIERVDMEVKYMSTEKEDDKVLSKTIAKYEAPQDVRHMGYLVVNKAEGADDQFVYLPSSRRVRRVNLRGESIVGTDFSLEDIIPPEFEDATYVRLPDETVSGIDCFVVEVTPKEESDSNYTKIVAYVEKDHYVPLRNVYWDSQGVKIKELWAEPASIARYEAVDKSGLKEVWVAQKSKVTNLKLDSFTSLDVVKLDANPKLRKRDFSQRTLTAGR